MNQGTVKVFNHRKGFRFIEESNDNKDYFVHSTNLLDKINDGDSVEFELEEDPKGSKAINVKLTEDQ